MNDMLATMIRSQEWADTEFLDAIERLEEDRHGAEYASALRLLDHINVVARIFAAHLAGEAHGFRSDTTEPTPTIEAVRAAAARTNRWYLDYVRTVGPEVLAERVRFTFTDGDKGCMSRQEMLTHVVLHGAVHRGEVGRILAQIGAVIPWDTFAVFLHHSEPARREANASLLLPT